MVLLPRIDELPPPTPGKTGWPWTVESGWSAPNRDLPRLSVVIPTLNTAAFLEEAIRSVLLQGIPEVECIVIDGGSTDESIEVITRYERWLACWVSEADSGQSNAINKGMRRATGDWVAWLNADDIYLPGAFEEVLIRSVSVEFTDWIVGVTLFVDENLTEVGSFRPDLNSHESRRHDFVTGSWLDFVCTKFSGTSLPQPSSFFSREAWRTSGSLDERLHLAMDHELYGRLARCGYLPTLVEEPLAALRVHPGQKSALDRRVFLEEEILVVDKWLRVCSAEERAVLRRYKLELRKRVRQARLKSVLSLISRDESV